MSISSGAIRQQVGAKDRPHWVWIAQNNGGSIEWVRVNQGGAERRIDLSRDRSYLRCIANCSPGSGGSPVYEYVNGSINASHNSGNPPTAVVFVPSGLPGLINKIVALGETKLIENNDGANETLTVLSGLQVTAELIGSPTALDTYLIPINTTGVSSSVTVPASPNFNTYFGVVDSRANASTNNITINFIGAGDNYYGVSQNYVLNTDGEFAAFRYINATVGWVKVG